MTARKGLRVASEADAPVKPKSITEAADKGTTRELLVAMRARVAAACQADTTPPKDLAALTNRLIQIQRDIEAIDARADQDAAESAASTPDAKFDASAV